MTTPAPVPPPDGIPVTPFGVESSYVIGNDWDANESVRAENFALSLVTQGHNFITRARALRGSHTAYLALQARTAAAGNAPISHLDVER